MNQIKKNKVSLLLILFIGTYFINIIAQEQQLLDRRPQTLEERREIRKNLVVKEINTDARGKRQWIDHLTVWGETGLKLEEIEYAVYGQKERVTYEYDANGICIRENVYNDKNKLYRIRKYEYHPNGRKKVQYNYNPDGKLFSTKVFEYSYQ